MCSRPLAQDLKTCDIGLCFTTFRKVCVNIARFDLARDHICTTHQQPDDDFTVSMLASVTVTYTSKTLQTNKGLSSCIMYKVTGAKSPRSCRMARQIPCCTQISLRLVLVVCETRQESLKQGAELQHRGYFQHKQHSCQLTEQLAGNTKYSRLTRVRMCVDQMMAGSGDASCCEAYNERIFSKLQGGTFAQKSREKKVSQGRTGPRSASSGYCNWTPIAQAGEPRIASHFRIRNWEKGGSQPQCW